MSVFDPVGLIGRDSKTTLSIRLILGIVSLEPDNVALPFKRQNMGGDPIEKPPVMADHNHRARKVFEGLLQCSQGIHIQVIRGLVQKKDIGSFLEHPCEVDTVSLSP